jgi:hypothetical protein
MIVGLKSEDKNASRSHNSSTISRRRLMKSKSPKKLRKSKSPSSKKYVSPEHSAPVKEDSVVE